MVSYARWFFGTSGPSTVFVDHFTHCTAFSISQMRSSSAFSFKILRLEWYFPMFYSDCFYCLQGRTPTIVNSWSYFGPFKWPDRWVCLGFFHPTSRAVITPITTIVGAYLAVTTSPFCEPSCQVQVKSPRLENASTTTRWVSTSCK